MPLILDYLNGFHSSLPRYSPGERLLRAIIMTLFGILCFTVIPLLVMINVMMTLGRFGFELNWWIFVRQIVFPMTVWVLALFLFFLGTGPISWQFG